MRTKIITSVASKSNVCERAKRLGMWSSEYGRRGRLQEDEAEEEISERKLCRWVEMRDWRK